MLRRKEVCRQDVLGIGVPVYGRHLPRGLGAIGNEEQVDRLVFTLEQDIHSQEVLGHRDDVNNVVTADRP
jgi:hypothetical protein